MSVDEGDNDPVQLLHYLIAAFQPVDGRIGGTVRQVLQSPQVPPVQNLVTMLVNDIGAAVDAFKDFTDLINRVDIKSRNDRMRERLERLKEIKEIRFRPLIELERKLNVRKVDRQDAMAKLDSPESLGLKPLDRTTPIRKR